MAETLFWISTAIAVFHAILVWAFLRLFRHNGTHLQESVPLPRATIVLPVRGVDPGFANSLSRLAQLDYPVYEVQIVVDNDLDPAFRIARHVVDDLGAKHMHVDVLNGKSPRCSPQCSAMLQAVRNADPDSEVFAFVDADVVADANWLRTLVLPLSDPEIGIAHGNRWYVPSDGLWGSWVRYLWNAGAVIPMCFFRIPWAGSLAIRKTVLHESGLIDTWEKSLVPDAPAKRLLDRMGLKILFIPELMIVNQEGCNLAFCLNFIKRQMTWTRTYHPHWWPVVLHALVATGLMLLTAATAIVGAATGRHAAVAWAIGGLLVSEVSLLVLAEAMERRILRVVRERGNAIASAGWWRHLMVPMALPLTLVLHLAAVLLATFKRTVVFRGVTYRIDRPFEVQMISDRPYSEASSAGENISLG